MAVGLPAKATLDASIFFTVFKSITIHGSYVGNRQDALEAINIAATGAVKCHYKTRKLSEIAEFVLSFFISVLILVYLSSFRVYDDLAKGKIAGRVVLSMD